MYEKQRALAEQERARLERANAFKTTKANEVRIESLGREVSELGQIVNKLDTQIEIRYKLKM